MAELSIDWDDIALKGISKIRCYLRNKKYKKVNKKISRPETKKSGNGGKSWNGLVILKK